MAEALGHAGQHAEGLAATEEAIARSESTEEHWAMAELLRVKGELLLMQGAPGAAAAAEDHFRRALDWARRQGTLSWELRAAMSLARLLGNQDRSAEGQAILRPVYERFTEGFETTDLRSAKALLEVVPQIILQGPPGTGKTYNAKRVAAHLLGIDPASVAEEEGKSTGQFQPRGFPERQMPAAGSSCNSILPTLMTILSEGFRRRRPRREA